MASTLKVGSKIKMYFFCAGITSEESRTIIALDDYTITTDSILHPDNPKSEGQEENEIFDRTTGKCLNDNTSFSSKRYIDPQ